MLKRLTAVASLALLMCGCRSAEPQETPRKPGADRAPENYAGPAVRASFENLRDLRVTVSAPSGGHRLVLRETGRGDGVTFVKLTLEGPGEGEAVTAAIEEKSVRVPLLVEKGAVHVRIQQIQRGAHYLTPPEFTLARIVER